MDTISWLEYIKVCKHIKMKSIIKGWNVRAPMQKHYTTLTYEIYGRDWWSTTFQQKLAPLLNLTHKAV